MSVRAPVRSRQGTRRVAQLLSAAGPHDAVTNQALAYARMMRSWSIEGHVYATVVVPELKRKVRPASQLAGELERDDLVVIHYTVHTRGLEEVLDLPQRKLLVYHNVTPPELLWDFEPFVAARCAVGRERLADYAGRVDAIATATRFNAADLVAAGFDDVRIVPNLYLFDRERLQPRANGTRFQDGKTNVIFVGRLAANKRQDELIKAFALYQRHRDPDSRLILAGGASGLTYRDRLEQLATAIGARDVVLTGPIEQPALNTAYAASSVFVCLSEHEGFCLPVLEALHFGLPVIAYRAGAVPEVAGDAAVMLDDKDLPTIAELIDLCAREQPLRTELARRGDQRLATYAPEHTERAMRELFESLL
jgi:glycosyltransferase involved in cell wall biosynthesis